jgi:hypothetical protein
VRSVTDGSMRQSTNLNTMGEGKNMSSQIESMYNTTNTEEPLEFSKDRSKTFNNIDEFQMMNLRSEMERLKEVERKSINTKYELNAFM